jgi:hypothetical protein
MTVMTALWRYAGAGITQSPVCVRNSSPSAKVCDFSALQ